MNKVLEYKTGIRKIIASKLVLTEAVLSDTTFSLENGLQCLCKSSKYSLFYHFPTLMNIKLNVTHKGCVREQILHIKNLLQLLSNSRLASG
jgi:hypothetical protein